MSKFWDRWGSKKLLVMATTLVGYFFGAVPDGVLQTTLAAYLGSQALADVASPFAGVGKRKLGGKK